jgi:DNA-directed RNA polymerase subunit A'
MAKNHKHEEIKTVQWSCLTGEQIKSLSVAHIFKPSSKDQIDNIDNRIGTVNDPRMGEQRDRLECSTCGQFNVKCSGHMGHIELPFPIYNLQYTDIVLKVLQTVCTHCCKPRIKAQHIEIQGFTKQQANKRLKELADKCNKSVKICPYCNESLLYFYLPVKKKGETGIIYYTVEHKKGAKREEYSAKETYNILSRISFEDLKIMGFNSTLLTHTEYTNSNYFLNEDMQHVHQFSANAMIYTVLPVLSPLARPFIEDDNGIKDDDLTVKYNDLLKSIELYNSFNLDGKKSAVATRRGHVKTKADVEKDIMNHVWTLVDNRDGEKLAMASINNKVSRSVIDRLIGKDGRIQQNVGGKRTNFSARSVIIGGGIRLKHDELGVPQDIAEIETHPIFVGDWNLNECQDLVRQGKVNYVLRTNRNNNTGLIETNTIPFAKFPDKGRSFILRCGDEIGRHLQNGDVVLFNRQPTLRLESMLAFRAKIVEGLCFMLPLAFTKGFNAD